MSLITGIEWTDHTWNPWHGCHKVSAGCKFCYMFSDKKRYGQDPNVVTRSKTKFSDPLKWPKTPARCFTCSWSDWFIEEADAWREEAYGIIRATPHITYQILTKRIERAAGRVPDPVLPNIWFGVSVEDQKTADERIPHLLRLRVAKRFVSYEPALGPIRLWKLKSLDFHENTIGYETYPLDGLQAMPDCDWEHPRLDWIIFGGESGHGARPCDIEWARNTRDQCKAAGVAFFMKQMGKNPNLVQMDGSALKDHKGGDMSEWPTDLQIREFPL